jgi:Fasciclin domain
MKNINKNIKLVGLSMIASMFMLTSCNKNLEQLPEITTPAPIAATGNIGATIAANPNDSLFYRLLVRSTMLPTLSDSSKRFTIFAVDNAGMKIFVNQASGGLVPLASPDAVFSTFIANTLPVASAAGIVQYLTTGQLLPTSLVATRFPNTAYPSLIQLDPVNTPFLRMTKTIAKGTAGNISYVNNVPSFGANDQVATNGIIHHIYSVAAPPTVLLRAVIDGKSNLTYWKAALLRADSGQVVKPNNDSTNFLNYFMAYGVLNQTVIAPSDAAFQTFIFSVVYGKALLSNATPAQATILANAAVAAGPAFLNTNNVSTAQVRGIVAYHILASDITGSIAPNIRAFSVNIPTTATFVKTLVNGSVAVHPGVRAIATFAGPATTSVTFTGFSALTGGAPFTDIPASVIDKDNNAVNGVLHTIDRVLVPQPL